MEIPVACITCGTAYPREAGRCPNPRCWRHKGAWVGRPRHRQLEYRTTEYRTNRKIVLEREPTCHWRFKNCTIKSTQADHLVPVAQGGTNELANLVGACGRCNALRGSSLGGQVAKAGRKQR